MSKPGSHTKNINWLIFFLILLAAFLTWWVFSGKIKAIDRKIEDHHHAVSLKKL